MAHPIRDARRKVDMSAPHPRLEGLLGGPSVWHALEHVPEATSTNDVAAQRLAEGVPAGLVVVADHQTAGRGRLGRPWFDRVEDRKERSLLVSVTVPVPSTATLAPLAAGLGASDAITRQRVDASLKWPNDVLVGDRKCGGILIEQHQVGSGTGATPFLVVGIGINVDWRGVPRDDASAAWTSVAEEAGRDVDRWDLLTDLLRSFEAWLQEIERGPSRLLTAYRGRCDTLGRRVRVVAGDEEVTGRARDVDRAGALVLETEAGTALVTFGDVTHVERLD